MATTWKFYADAGLTVEISPVDFAQANGGAAVDRLIYFGSVASAKKLQKGSSPGVAQVTLAIEDTASGSGLATTVLKLALSADGLAGATGGAPLNLGATLLSGVGNAVPVFVRANAGSPGVGTYTDLRFNVGGIIESDQ